MTGKVPHDPKELIALVDKEDHVIGRCRRKNHAGGGLHREVGVLIVNKEGKVLLQTRDDKSLGFADFLDYSAGGHFHYNESYLDGAVREVLEELGLKIPRVKFRKIAKRRITSVHGRRRNDRFTTLYEVVGNYLIGDIKIDTSEVKAVRFYTLGDVKKLLRREHNGGFKTMMNIYLRKRGF